MNLNEKRDLLRQRQKAASAKIRRLKNEGVYIERPVKDEKTGKLVPRQRYGVDVAGSEFDPRVKKDISRMNSKQIDAALRRINKFTDRKTSFVPDMNGKPIPERAWNAYKTVEARYNKQVKTAFDKVKHVRLQSSGNDLVTGKPVPGETIDNRMARRAGTFAGMATDGQHTPYKHRNVLSTQVTSAAAVDKLTRSMRKQANFDFLARRDRINRRNVDEKMQQIGNSDLLERIRALNGNQFRTLFLFSSFGEDFSQISGTLNDLATMDELDDAGMQMYDNAVAGMESLIEWAEKLEV